MPSSYGRSIAAAVFVLAVSGIKTVAFWAKASTTLAVAQGLVNLTGSSVYISTNSSKALSATGFTSPTYYI